MRRRAFVLASAVALLPPARATPAAMAEAIRDFTGGAALREGKVKLEVAPLVDNGNTVPVSLSVPEVPPQQVLALALFNEHNPKPEVIRASFGPRAGARTIATRMRLATSPGLVAVARLADGSCWSQRVEVVVTLSACLE
jgi:sulfur-oxidizing protein SoxY